MVSQLEVNMKKFVKISVVILLVFAIAVAAFTATRTSSAMAAGGFCPNVGWNSRSFGCLSALQQSGFETLAYQLAPGTIINVGWNT
jgi:hypothetical protein